MDVSRTEDGGALVRMDNDEVRDLLGAFALSMAAFGILQNFMTLQQKTLAMPSLLFISRLGAVLAEGEDFGEDEEAAEADG